jgi:hypothetical protein
VVAEPQDKKLGFPFILVVGESCMVKIKESFIDIVMCLAQFFSILTVGQPRIRF